MLAKFGDDLLIGMEHTRRISDSSVLPITESKIEILAETLSPYVNNLIYILGTVIKIFY